MSSYDDINNDTDDSTRDLYEQTKETLSSAYEKAKDEAEHLTNQAKTTAEQVYNATYKQSNNLVASIKQNLLASVLLSAGIGYMLFYLIKKYTVNLSLKEILNDKY